MKEAIKYSEFKERSVIKFEVPLWSAQHFQDEVTKKEITISPAEQIRYEQNIKLANAITNQLNWLIDTQSLDEKTLEDIFINLQRDLTPAQSEVMARVKSRLSQTVKESLKIDQRAIKKMYDKIVAEKHFPSADDISIHPTGAVIVKSSNWPLMHLDVGGFTYEPTEADKKSLDPAVFEFLQKLVVIRNTPEEKGKPTQEDIIRHETFHYLYNLAIRPENTTAYKFETEKRYFLQTKNEMLAYLLIGKWPWNAKELLSDLKPDKRLITDVDDRTNDEVLLQVYQKICKEIGTKVPKEEYKNETEGYPDEMYLAIREMARLYCIDSQNFDNAVKAVLTSQSFKEMTFNLKKIDGEVKLFWKDSLPAILKLPSKECAHRIHNFATLQRDYRLRFKLYTTDENHADWEYFYNQIKAYIQDLKKDPDDEDKSIAVNELTSLLRSFGVELED